MFDYFFEINRHSKHHKPRILMCLHSLTVTVHYASEPYIQREEKKEEVKASDI